MRPDIHLGPLSLKDIRVSRRTFLHGAGAVATLVIAAGINQAAGGFAVSTTTEPVAASIARLKDQDPEARPYGKYIHRDSTGVFVSTERKQDALRRIRVEPRQIDVVKTDSKGGKYFVRNTLVIFNIGKPQQNTTEELRSIDLKNEFFGLEIAGASYPDGQGLGYTSIRKTYEDPNGQFEKMGRWFLITDSSGQPIDLEGHNTYYPENFVYLTADQAIILPNPQVTPLGAGRAK